MAVRSSRLAGPVQVQGTTTSTLFTVPSGETWLVKWLTIVSNDGSAAHDLQFYVDTVGTTHYIDRVPVPVLAGIQREVWWVLEPGESLLARHGTSGHNTTVTVNGAELEGVAD